MSVVEPCKAWRIIRTPRFQIHCPSAALHSIASNRLQPQIAPLANMPEHIRTVAVVGCGVIGMSWGALFLSKGHRVIISDPVEGVEERFRQYLQDVKSLFKGDEDFERLLTNYEFVSDVTSRLGEADFVQEVRLHSLCNGVLDIHVLSAIHLEWSGACGLQTRPYGEARRAHQTRGGDCIILFRSTCICIRPKMQEGP